MVAMPRRPVPKRRARGHGSASNALPPAVPIPPRRSGSGCARAPGALRRFPVAACRPSPRLCAECPRCSPSQLSYGCCACGMAVRQRPNRQCDEIPAHAVGCIRVPQLAEPGIGRSPARMFTAQERDQTTTWIVRWRSQRHSGDSGKLFWRRIGDIRSRFAALLEHQLRKFVADQVDAHIVVVECAEYLLERFHPLDLPLAWLPELRSKQFEGVTQSLG